MQGLPLQTCKMIIMNKNAREKFEFKQFFQELKADSSRYFFFAFLFFLLLLLPGQNYYQTLALIPAERKFLEVPFAIPTPAPYPEKIGKEEAPQVSAEGAVVMDVDSQVVLYQKNPHQKLLPASTTKIMTALVVLSTWQPTDVLEIPDLATQSATATDSALMGLRGGEKVNVQSLLYGLLLNSGADAAYTLSMDYQGSQSAFLKAMNDKAKELHLNDTKYQNEIGLDDKEQYTSVIDLARLSTFALKNPLFAKIVSTKNITVSDVFKKHWYGLTNLNKLLWEEPGVTGIKTGFTEQAGECLVALVERDGKRILTVVLKSQDRFTDSQKLSEWAYRNYEWSTVTTNF